MSLPAGARVLDLGCGGGTFPYAGSPSLEIHALDEAVHQNVKSFPPNALFIRARASALPEISDAFDLVIVNFAFEHFPEPIVAVREIERVMKNGAYAWMSMPNSRSFEDQLYRNLFAGGGHLQSPTIERFLRLIYQHTGLKLISLVELPAGFTFLGDSPELRHLTWAIIDALRRSVAIDAPSRSGCIFVLQKFLEAGPGYREYLRTCHACGTPDGCKTGGESETQSEPTADWTCARCGVRNSFPSSLQAIRLDEVERAQKLQWERFPHTNPARLQELVDERGRWGQQLERELETMRRLVPPLLAARTKLKSLVNFLRRR